MGIEERGNSGGTETLGDAPSLPVFVDWIVAAVIALAGLALLVGGSALTFLVDRELLAEDIESGRITVVVVQRELTAAEMLEFTHAVVTWTGIGLLVTGIALVLFAIWYAVARHRAHRRARADGSAGSFHSAAVFGAVATAVLSFLPLSPVVGGGAAGYLERHGSGRSTSVGAASGFLAMAPLLAILGFVTAGIYAGFLAIGDSALGLVTVAAMLCALLFVGAYGASLGTLGGFIGGRLAES